MLKSDFTSNELDVQGEFASRQKMEEEWGWPEQPVAKDIFLMLRSVLFPKQKTLGPKMASKWCPIDRQATP